nr:hypothetical protein [uncultured Flavobacterium sp.]
MKKIKRLRNEILELKKELKFLKWLNQYYNIADLELQKIILREIKIKKRQLTILQIVYSK